MKYEFEFSCLKCNSDFKKEFDIPYIIDTQQCPKCKSVLVMPKEKLVILEEKGSEVENEK